MVIVNPGSVIQRTRIENATYIINQVQDLGLKVNPTSRLKLMDKVLSQGYVPFDHPNFPTVLEAERDLQYLGFVFDQVNANRDNPRFMKLVRDLLCDSVSPQDSVKNSPGRDAQFELYLAAVCQNAKLLPVDFAEPDVICVIQGTRFGIAAKRLKSLSSLREHVRKGTEQIEKAGVPGMIALELTLALNRKNSPIISPLQSQMQVMIAHTQNRQFFDEHAKDISRWVSGKGVLAVVVFNSWIRLVPDSSWELGGLTTWLDANQTDEQAKKQYWALHNGFTSGIPNVKEAIL